MLYCHHTSQVLLTETRVLYKELDKNNSVRAVFLDIAKAFDKVSHKGLIYKFEIYGATGNILYWLTNYLTNRSQKVVIKGSSSDWRHIKSGVPQGYYRNYIK